MNRVRDGLIVFVAAVIVLHVVWAAMVPLLVLAIVLLIAVALLGMIF